jgi:UDP-N-acetylmuramoyl-tripeptide--D-alanyl-D-alanine ligase
MSRERMSRSHVVLGAKRVAEVMGARLVAGAQEREFEGVTTDSRRVAPGQLFVALRGERFDGAAFAASALAAGASGVVVPAGTAVAAPGDAVVIEADDTLVALQQLGQFVRRESGTSVVAITGSAGKTSTKEAAAEFLAARYEVYRNPGNLNNHIGVPLTLIELRSRPDVAVVELGMNHAGEIRRLVELAEPDVRVWTNVVDAHVGHFASVDAIADAKAEVLEDATEETRAVLNADDARVMSRAAAFRGRVTTFGTAAGADVRATAIRDLGVSGSEAHVTTPAGEADLRVSIPGRGALLNVLAATAVALSYGVPLPAIAERAATLHAAPRRGDVTRLGRGVVLVDDSYNSSPAALARALDALATETVAARRVAVLGEMRELGDFATELHETSGRRAATAGLGLLVAVGGSPAKALADAAVAAGMPAALVRYYPTSAEAAPAVAAALAPGDVVLVKGSRGTRTDLVADRVKAEWA